MDRDHRLIDKLILRVHDFAEMLRLRRKLRRRFAAAKNFVGNRNGVLAANTDNRDRAFTGRCGNRGDGFALIDLSILRYCERAFFNAAMHFSFCSIVPMETRTHSARP